MVFTYLVGIFEVLLIYHVVLRTGKYCLSCALVWGRGAVFRRYCKSIAKRAGKAPCDGAVVTFEYM